MPPFGGHVHIEYHNHSYHRPPLRHFVALFSKRGRKNVTGFTFSASYVMKSITVISHLRWLSPLWCLTAPPSRPTGKRVARFSGRFAPLRIVFPCHRGIGRATKGKRLYGQARRLTSPDLHILCRMCTVDNKAPQSNPFTQRIAKNKVPPPGGRWWRQPPKGVHFPRPQGGCKGFFIRGRLL